LVIFLQEFPTKTDFSAQNTREAIPGLKTIIVHVDCPSDPSDGENEVEVGYVQQHEQL